MWTAGRLVALVAALAGCLAAVAYAATPHEATPAPSEGRAHGRALPRPLLRQHPRKLATSATAMFGFSARGRRPRFQCRLDTQPWERCRSPFVLRGLSEGRHRFAVRTVGERGAHSGPARFGWRVLRPRDLTIAPRLGDLDELYPGAPPLPLPLTISNPNGVPIFVTAVTVAATAGPAGCAGTDNLALTAAGVSDANPLRVPAHGSVELPASGVAAPSIQLRDLPVNQDACQNATFPLTFSGSARG